MEIDLIWIGLGIAVDGYFIGDGLKNFKNQQTNAISDIFDDNDEHEQIKVSVVHDFMSISKEDAKHLNKDHPGIPHIKIKHNVYYPQGKLREWMKNLAE